MENIECNRVVKKMKFSFKQDYGVSIKNPIFEIIKNQTSRWER